MVIYFYLLFCLGCWVYKPLLNLLFSLAAAFVLQYCMCIVESKLSLNIVKRKSGVWKKLE